MLPSVELRPVKATPLDDDAVRLLAIPFTGPIPRPGTRGVDLDGDWFSPRTDIKAGWLPFRPVDWHHGWDEHIGKAIIGKALDLGDAKGASKDPDDDGWWVTVWLDQQRRQTQQIRMLSGKVDLYGSSQTVSGLIRKADSGEILTWPYMRQTLSPIPRNTHSVLRPMKATLDDLDAAGERPSADFWSDVEDALRDLGASLRRSSETGTDGAKAGQERAVREALDRMDRVVARATAITTR